MLVDSICWRNKLTLNEPYLLLEHELVGQFLVDACTHERLAMAATTDTGLVGACSTLAVPMRIRHEMVALP